MDVEIDHKTTFKKNANTIKRKCIRRSRHFRKLTYKNQELAEKRQHTYTTQYVVHSWSNASNITNTQEQRSYKQQKPPP